MECIWTKRKSSWITGSEPLQHFFEMWITCIKPLMSLALAQILRVHRMKEADGEREAAHSARLCCYSNSNRPKTFPLWINTGPCFKKWVSLLSIWQYESNKSTERRRIEPEPWGHIPLGMSRLQAVLTQWALGILKSENGMPSLGHQNKITLETKSRLSFFFLVLFLLLRFGDWG